MSDKQPKNNIFDQLQDVSIIQDEIKDTVNKVGETTEKSAIDTEQTRLMVEGLINAIGTSGVTSKEQSIRLLACLNPSYAKEMEFTELVKTAKVEYQWGTNQSKQFNFNMYKFFIVLTYMIINVLAIGIAFIEYKILGIPCIGLVTCIYIAINYKCLFYLMLVKVNTPPSILRKTNLLGMRVDKFGIWISRGTTSISFNLNIKIVIVFIAVENFMLGFIIKEAKVIVAVIIISVIAILAYILHWYILRKFLLKYKIIHITADKVKYWYNTKDNEIKVIE